MNGQLPLLRVCDFAHPAVDDRGDPVRLANRKEFERQFAHRSIRARRFKLRTAYTTKCERPEPRCLGLTLSSLVTLFMLLSVLVATLLIALTTIDTGATVLTTIILFLSFAVAHSHYRNRGTTFLIAMSAAAEGLCASCAFSLEGLSADQGGLLTCPECGHAWNALRIVRPHWEPDPAGLIPKRDPRLDLRHNLRLTFTSRFISDDCGRLVRAHTSYLLSLDPEIRAQRTDAEWKGMRLAIRCNGRYRRIFMSVLLITVTMIGVVRWSLPAMGEDVGEFVSSLVVLAFPLTGGVLAYLGDGWVGQRRMARVLNSEGLCGGCCNELTRCPANANGMRVCDRCRSSWLDENFPHDKPGPTQLCAQRDSDSALSLSSPSCQPASNSAGAVSSNSPNIL